MEFFLNWLNILKKLAAILLLVLFLLNTIGYRIALFFAERESDIHLEASLDRDLYNEDDLVTITVPLSLPYLNNQSQFERVDGEIRFNGKIYKYVKRKVIEGSLILLCLPDYNKMRLQSEANDSYKNINDITAGSNSKKSSNSKSVSLKNIFSEFNKSELAYTSHMCSIQTCYSSSNKICKLISFPHITPEQPPERV